MPKKIYQQPKMKLPILAHFKIRHHWQKNKMSQKEKEEMKQTAAKVDSLLLTMLENDRNQLVKPPSKHYDPSVTIAEWNDFLAVIFKLKPACLIGTNFRGKSYNPIAKFAQKYAQILPNLAFADAYEFGMKPDFIHTYYIKNKNSFIYNPKMIEKIVKKYPKIYNGLKIGELNSFLKKIYFNSDNDRSGFHLKLGLLLGYSYKDVKNYVKKEQENQ